MLGMASWFPNIDKEPISKKSAFLFSHKVSRCPLISPSLLCSGPSAFSSLPVSSFPTVKKGQRLFSWKCRKKVDRPSWEIDNWVLKTEAPSGPWILKRCVTENWTVKWDLGMSWSIVCLLTSHFNVHCLSDHSQERAWHTGCRTKGQATSSAFVLICRSCSTRPSFLVQYSLSQKNLSLKKWWPSAAQEI